MPALPTLTEADLDDAQRAVWDIVTGGQRHVTMRLVGEEGGLSGPFNSMLYAPGLGRHLAAVGEEVRFHSSLPHRLVELATVTVAAHWRSEFEWAIHARLATEAGVPADVLAATARHEVPDLDDPAEALSVAVARDLLEDGKLSAENGTKAIEVLGQQGLVELVGLVGYYCTVAFLLETFEVPLPADAAPVWGDQ